FSSRRRHTRCLSDWSSDVCSSDLNNSVITVPPMPNDDRLVHWKLPCFTTTALIANGNDFDASAMVAAFVEKADRGCRENVSTNRSEERRVGKECRMWG